MAGLMYKAPTFNTSTIPNTYFTYNRSNSFGATVDDRESIQ